MRQPAMSCVIPAAPSGEAWIIVEVDGTDRLYRTDGTSAGTDRFTAPPIGSLGSRLSSTPSGLTLFAVGDNGDEGLWASEGSSTTPPRSIRSTRGPQRRTHRVRGNRRSAVRVGERIAGGRRTGRPGPGRFRRSVKDIVGVDSSNPEQFTEPTTSSTSSPTMGSMTIRCGAPPARRVELSASPILLGYAVRDLAGGPTVSSSSPRTGCTRTTSLRSISARSMSSRSSPWATTRSFVPPGTSTGFPTDARRHRLVVDACARGIRRDVRRRPRSADRPTSGTIRDLWVTDVTVSRTRKASGWTPARSRSSLSMPWASGHLVEAGLR